MQNLINIENEIQRLNKEIIKIKKEILRAESKLANVEFVKKAPPKIIMQEQQRLADFIVTHTKLQNQLNSFKNN